MANFSSNEIRHFYVVTSVDNSGNSLPDNAPDGALALRSNADGDQWFEYKSPNGGSAVAGGIVRTDIIEKGKLTYVKSKESELIPFPRKEITLDPNLNGGVPVVGQKYVFRVRFYGMGVGNNDIQYSKSSGVYTAKPGDTAEKVFTELVEMFVKGYKNEPEQ